MIHPTIDPKKIDSSRDGRVIRIAILADMPLAALEEESRGRGGGHAATWLPQLAHAYAAQKDFEIHWLILSPRVKEFKASRHLGQQFYEIPKRPMTIEVLTGYPVSRRRLLSVLHRMSPDIVHVWGSESAYPSVLETMRKSGIPTIMSMQGILTEYNRIGSFDSNWRMKLQAQYEKRWVRQASVVTSESAWGLTHVHGMAPDIRTDMVEYGVNPSFYDISWNPDPATPALLFCGGADWRKGYDLLVEALTIQPVPLWKCWIAGGGITPDMIKKLPSNVEALGNLAWGDLQQRMSRAWGLVLPTRADTSPNAVKEARVIGLPVITSMHGGQSGYIKQGENGMIIDPLTPARLRAAMDQLTGDFMRCRQMGTARHDADREYFKPEHTAKGFLKIYREMAEKSGRMRVMLKSEKVEKQMRL